MKIQGASLLTLALLFWQVPLARAANADDLPAGFEQAIVNESASDQSSPQLSKKNSEPKDADAFIRRVIQYSELYGAEAPMDEAGCHRATASRADFEACRDLVERRSEVLSSRQAGRKKLSSGGESPGSEKASLNFTAE